MVGANNVGKSKALQNIASQTGARDLDATEHIVVESELEWDTDKEAAVQWFSERFPTKNLASGTFYEARRHRISVDKAERDVRAGTMSTRIGRLVSVFANAEERLSLTKAVQAIDLAEAQPEHPIHILAREAELIEQLSALSEAAFGVALTLDTTGGNTFVLRLGIPSVEPDFTRHGIPTREYVSALRRLPALENQGHGIRSYAGMLMELLAGSHLFVLIDEPEAFLHPPQAEKIGRAISDLKRHVSQVFVATHDANVVKGFLSSQNSEDVLIVRIKRSGETNPASVLQPKDLEALWSNPALRYSNVLDGLFSEGTLVCEGDPDCRLYESAIDNIDDAGSSGIHFTHGGGSGRIPVIASALTAVSVPTAVVVDLDLLAKRDLLRSIVESIGGAWSSAWDPLLNAIESGVSTLAETPTKATIEKAVLESLDGVNDEDPTPAEALNRIAKVARKTTGWQKLKRGGRAILPGGQCITAFDTLLKEMSDQGVFLVWVGELERWFPAVGGHGPAHVSEVHEKGLLEGPEGAELRLFVEGIRSYLSRASGRGPSDSARTMVQMVIALRKETGAAIRACKEALEKSNGDYDAAKGLLEVQSTSPSSQP